jgi:hypothetical protein
VADSKRIEDLRRRVQMDPASIAFARLAEECRRAGLELHPGYLSTQGRDQTPNLLAVLEQWLDATHGSRTQPRS